MSTPPTGIEEYLEHCFSKFVKPLLDDLELKIVDRQVHDLGGLYEMRSGHLIVRLVNDRGLASLEIAASSQPGNFWDLELVAGLFEPPLPRGIRRLNLEEQAKLLRDRWSELNQRFTSVRYLFTRRTLHRLGADRASALFGPGV